MDFLVKAIVVAVCLSQLKVESALRLPRLSVAEKSPGIHYYNNIDGNPGAYSFNYDISDDVTGNTQYRTEERYPNGTVAGAYGYVDAFGAPQRFRYVADQAGYRVFRDSLREPFYGHPTSTPKPIDKIAVDPTEPSITWTRPKRPNKNKIHPPKLGFQKYNYGNHRYNLIGLPSAYVSHY